MVGLLDDCQMAIHLSCYGGLDVVRDFWINHCYTHRSGGLVMFFMKSSVHLRSFRHEFLDLGLVGNL